MPSIAEIGRMSATVILSRNEVAGLLSIEECMNAVEAAFKSFAEGKTSPPKVLGLHTQGGGLHIKAGIMQLESNYIVAKMNSNFPANATNFNLPTIQGAVAVFDADNGSLLALMDSIEITIIRTGAATGVAAKYLSRKYSNTLTLYGCGNQALISFKAITTVRPIEKVFLYDIIRSKAEVLSGQLRAMNPRVTVTIVDDVTSALKTSDIIVTCTTSKTPIVNVEHVKPGTFIAAVGCDSEEKSEIHPQLMAKSKVVTDFTEQSAAFGDLHHAIASGLVGATHVHAELGQVIAGHKTSRENEEDIIIFDSTGTALQDVSAASIVYERAVAASKGQRFDFQR
jgi:alanine dehydrogenase